MRLIELTGQAQREAIKKEAKRRAYKKIKNRLKLKLL